MDKGIYLGPEIYPEGVMPPPERLERVEVVSIVPKLGPLDAPEPIIKKKKIEEQEEEDVIDTEIDLANITPAVGADDTLEGEVFEEREIAHPQEKDVSDVLMDLGVAPAEEESIAESAEIEPVIEDMMGENTTQPYIEPSGTGMIAIIIDDMGLSLRSKQVEVMEGPLTLSYLPYAKNLNDRAQKASANGHEVMLHMPMEPLNGKLDGGPNVLLTTQNETEFLETLEWGLSSFDGFVGLNNHMGSRLTRDKDSMTRLMTHLKGKGLFFVDSKTISTSVAAETAQETGIPYATRDVFLDHEISADFVKDALKKLEQTAYEKGHAIAIGHPHKETIAALKEWLPTLADKGLTLVPASTLVKQPVAVDDDIVQVDR